MPKVVSIKDVLREAMAITDYNAQFSSAPAFEDARIRVAIAVATTSPELREAAISSTMELLEEFPWVALSVLRRLAPEPHPVIPEEHHGNLLYNVEAWLLWAIQHGHITERSHHFLAWIQVVREVEKTCMALLTEWKTGSTRGVELTKLGQQYPSIVLGRVLTGWALDAGKRRQEEWHELLAAITGISDPVENMRQAPIQGSSDDPGSPLTRWVEWYQRWRPVVAPFAIWPPKEETEKR